MPTLTTQDGTRIFYAVDGPSGLAVRGGKGRPPLLFVHGWCSNLTHWDAVTRHFAHRHRVLAVDRRGHGRSEVPAVGYTAEQHASDIAEVAGQEKLASAVVVGHAGGGPSALALARSYPELVRAVVLVDSIVAPEAKLDDPDDPGGAALSAIIDGLEGENGAAELEKMYAGFFSPHAGSVGRRALAEALKTPLEVAVAELRSLASGTQAIARELTQPVLWVSVAAADQAALGAVFQHVQFGQVVGSGHFPHIEVPDQLIAMIDRFVATL